MANQVLAQNVYVGDTWYGPDYDNAAVPAKIAKQILNPNVWVVDEPAPETPTDPVDAPAHNDGPFLPPDVPADAPVDVDPVIAGAQQPAPDTVEDVQA